MAERVLGVLAGMDMPDVQLDAWCASADLVYAADSAANRLVKLGHCPVVVGDLDSFDHGLEGQVSRVVRDVDPNRTDCDKLLDLALAEGQSSLTMVSVEGDLPDHALASLSSFARSRLEVNVAFRSGIGRVLKPGATVNFEKGFGRRVSLLPLGRCTGVTLRGVVWELEEATLELGGHLSVSNEGTGQVSARIRSGSALLFVARSPGEGPDWRTFLTSWPNH